MATKPKLLHPYSSPLFRGFLGMMFTVLLWAPVLATDVPHGFFEFTGRTMGTSYSVKVAKFPPGPTRKQIQAEIDRRLELINDQMSTYRPDSQLSRFNKSQGTDWFEVSPATATVVAEALRISELSDGAFDVTVGPLVNLWRFGPDKANKGFPTDHAIAEAKARVGYRKLQVRLDPPALKKAQPNVYVDLSAIAKGYAVDQLAGYLDELGLSNYLVEIGGEVIARGTKSNDRPWRVGIESPLYDQRQLHMAIELNRHAMATSGDYRNYFEHEGKHYSHTIDPRTGRPVDHTLASVTVVTDNCMTADALATAIMVMGPNKGFQLAKEQNLAVFLMMRDGDKFTEKATGQFQQLSVTAAGDSPMDSGRSGPDQSGSGGSSMTLFFASLAIFALAVTGMAVGVILSNRRIKGTCGGLANMRDATGGSPCDFCINPSPDCPGPESKDPSELKQPEPTSDEAIA